MSRNRRRRFGALAAVLATWAAPALALETTAGESADRHNVVFAELGGGGLGATLNYERRLAPRVGLRVGGGVVALVGPSFVAMPQLVFGEARHQASVGVGLVGAWVVEAETRAVRVVGEASYQFRSAAGLFLRASVGVLDGEAIPVPGLSLGWTF